MRPAEFKDVLQNLHFLPGLLGHQRGIDVLLSSLNLFTAAGSCCPPPWHFTRGALCPGVSPGGPCVPFQVVLTAELGM